MATRELTKVNICAYLTLKLEEYGHKDGEVTKQHLIRDEREVWKMVKIKKSLFNKPYLSDLELRRKHSGGRGSQYRPSKQRQKVGRWAAFYDLPESLIYSFIGFNGSPSCNGSSPLSFLNSYITKKKGIVKWGKGGAPKEAERYLTLLKGKEQRALNFLEEFLKVTKKDNG